MVEYKVHKYIVYKCIVHHFGHSLGVCACYYNYYFIFLLFIRKINEGQEIEEVRNDIGRCCRSDSNLNHLHEHHYLNMWFKAQVIQLNWEG